MASYNVLMHSKASELQDHASQCLSYCDEISQRFMHLYSANM